MELAFLDAIQTYLASPFFNTVMPLVTHLGDAGGAFWFLVGLILIIPRKTRIYGFAIVGALVLSVLIGGALKPLVHRVRPFMVSGYQLIVSPPSGSSFPSSHAMASFAAATVICMIPGKKALLLGGKIVAVLLALVVCFSRLYLYVHYPSDVLAGIIIGIILGLLAVFLARKYLPNLLGRLRRKPSGKHVR